MAAPFRWGDDDDFRATRIIRSGREFVQASSDARFVRTELGDADGEGYVEYLCAPGLRVVVFDCSFREPQTLLVEDAGWVRLNFSLDLKVGMGFGKRPVAEVSRPSWQLLSMPPGELVVETMPAEVRLQWVTVCCRPERLGDLAGVAPDDLSLTLTGAPPPEDGIVHQRRPFEPKLESATIDMVTRPRLHGGLGASYVANKSNELVILGLDLLMSDQAVRAVGPYLSRRDLQALHDARAMMERDLRDPPTIRELTRSLALNRNKLFYGFKSTFGMTVSEHLRASRLGEGRRLVLESDLTIAAIAEAVGFGHQGNFTTAFKGRYGMTPLAMRQQARGGLPH